MSTGILLGHGGGSSIPSGLICMWSGSSSNIPSGWVLCNGSNGTPDLRNRFVLGAGSSYSVGAKGGESTVTLTVEQMPSHSHEYKFNNSYLGVGYANYQNTYMYANQNSYAENSKLKILSTGGGQAHNNMPPYYALCFIMKQ